MRPRGTAPTISSWAVLFALLLGCVAPTLMRAMPSGDGEGWRAICSSVGVRWIDPTGAAPLGKTAPVPNPPHRGEHCPWCSLHTMALGLPPAPLSLLPLLSLGHAVPMLFLAAPHTLHAWSKAQPRAPPRVC